MADAGDRAAQYRRIGRPGTSQPLSGRYRYSHRAARSAVAEPRAASRGAAGTAGEGTDPDLRPPERRRSIHFAIGPTVASARKAGAALNAVGRGTPRSDATLMSISIIAMRIATMICLLLPFTTVLGSVIMKKTNS